MLSHCGTFRIGALYLLEGSPGGQSGCSFLRRIVRSLKDVIISITLMKIWKNLLVVCHCFVPETPLVAWPKSLSCRVLGSQLLSTALDVAH